MRMTPWRSSAAHLAAILAIATGCGSSGARPPAPPPAPGGRSARDAFEKAADRFLDDYLARFPDHGAELGLHQFDGKLPDMTPAGIAATVEWLHAQVSQFEAIR